MEVAPIVSEYMGIVIAMCLAFGAVFELPIVIVLLTALGIVQPAFLAKFRRHAFVGCIIAAALITPGQDPTSLDRADDPAVPPVRGVDHALAPGEGAPRQAHRRPERAVS